MHVCMYIRHASYFICSINVESLRIDIQQTWKLPVTHCVCVCASLYVRVCVRVCLYVFSPHVGVFGFVSIEINFATSHKSNL